jgi:DNA polymerase
MQADYSSVEGRVLAWVAGETTALTAYDTGVNLYFMNLTNMFGIPYGQITKKHPLYMVGKVIELALGYQGGVAAFCSMAKNYMLDLHALARDLYDQNLLPDVERGQALKLHANPRFRRQVAAAGLPKDVWVAMDVLKRLWRNARPATVGLWRQVDDAVRWAIDNPGQVYTAGAAGMLRMVVTKDVLDQDWLRIQLPSGRELSYMWPKISGRPLEDDENETEDADTIVSYWAYTEKGLNKIYSYGGKFVENIVQAIARDLLAYALVNLEKKKWNTIMHVHDETVNEVRIDDPRTIAELESDMCELPDWALKPTVLPLAAEGEILYRYKKG